MARISVINKISASKWITPHCIEIPIWDLIDEHLETMILHYIVLNNDQNWYNYLLVESSFVARIDQILIQKSANTIELKKDQKFIRKFLQISGRLAVLATLSKIMNT